MPLSIIAPRAGTILSFSLRTVNGVMYATGRAKVGDDVVLYSAMGKEIEAIRIAHQAKTRVFLSRISELPQSA